MSFLPSKPENGQSAFIIKLRSRHSLIQVPTVEEWRLTQFLVQFATQRPEEGYQRVQRWSCTQGLAQWGVEGEGGKARFGRGDGATEAAGVGAAGGLLFAVMRRAMSWREFIFLFPLQ